MQRGALTPRETRIIEYLHAAQEDFFPLGKWPAYLIDLILKPHKDNRERYTLFYFLTGNGLNPETARLWTLLLDVRKDGQGIDVLVPGGYDVKAHEQMEQMTQQLANGSLFTGNKKMMDMTLGRVVQK